MNNKYTSMNKNLIWLTVLFIIYRMILDLVYYIWASPIYTYMGLVMELNIIKYFISYILFFLILILIPKNNNKISYSILQVHFAITIVPLTSIYGLANMSTKFMIMIAISFLLQVQLLKFLPKLKLIKVKGAKHLFGLIIILLSAITYIYLFTTQKLNLSVFDFSKIYEVRSEQKISLGIMNYLVTWQYRMINPILIVFSYYKKYRKMLLFSIGMQVLLYLMIPHKEIIFAIFLIMLVLFTEYKKIQFNVFFLKFLVFFAVVSGLYYEITGKIMALGAGPVRLLYLPALIKFWHYNFFSVNNKLYYSEGIIGSILGIEYPYSVSSGFLVMKGMGNANVGYIGYAYDNAGFIGMILISLLFVMLLQLIDSLTIDENKMVVLSLIIYPMIILNDGDLLTLLLTGGLFILVLLLFILKDINLSENQFK